LPVSRPLGLPYLFRSFFIFSGLPKSCALQPIFLTSCPTARSSHQPLGFVLSARRFTFGLLSWLPGSRKSTIFCINFFKTLDLRARLFYTGINVSVCLHLQNLALGFACQSGSSKKSSSLFDPSDPDSRVNNRNLCPARSAFDSPFQGGLGGIPNPKIRIVPFCFF
jgi:hypothetical protein